MTQTQPEIELSPDDCINGHLEVITPQHANYSNGMQYYSATFRTTKGAQEVFIKIPFDSDMELQVERERQLHARCNGDFVLPLIDVQLQHKGRPLPCIATPYALGSLDDLAHTYRPQQRALLLAQACAGLHDCHARGIVHRDVHAGNIFLADDLDAKLGDFGHAAQTTDNFVPNEFISVYDAPECRRARAKFACLSPRPAEDAYALAITARSILRDAQGGLRYAIEANTQKDPRRRPGIEPLLYELQNYAGVEIRAPALTPKTDRLTQVATPSLLS